MDLFDLGITLVCVTDQAATCKQRTGTFEKIVDFCLFLGTETDHIFDPPPIVIVLFLVNFPSRL